jgi:hypothetical protein
MQAKFHHLEDPSLSGPQILAVMEKELSDGSYKECREELDAEMR